MYVCSKARCPKRIGTSGSPGEKNLGYACSICSRSIVEKKSGLSTIVKFLILSSLMTIAFGVYVFQDELGHIFSSGAVNKVVQSNGSDKLTKNLYEVALLANQKLLQKSKNESQFIDIYRQALVDNEKITLGLQSFSSVPQKKSNKDKPVVGSIQLISEDSKLILHIKEVLSKKEYFYKNNLNVIYSIDDVANAISNFVVFNSNKFNGTRQEVDKVRKTILMNFSQSEKSNFSSEITSLLKRNNGEGIDFLKNELKFQKFTIKQK